LSSICRVEQCIPVEPAFRFKKGQVFIRLAMTPERDGLWGTLDVWRYKDSDGLPSVYSNS